MVEIDAHSIAHERADLWVRNAAGLDRIFDRRALSQESRQRLASTTSWQKETEPCIEGDRDVGKVVDLSSEFIPLGDGRRQIFARATSGRFRRAKAR